MNPNMPVVHEAPYPDGPTATEYFLPQPEIPDDVRAGLSPWMLYIVTSVKPVALRTINERLSRIEHPDLQPLCEQLRSYTPVSVIFCEDKQSWLRLDSNHTSNKVGTSAYLPPQPDENLIQARLDSAGFSSKSLFLAFAMNFCGLAEDFLVSGRFVAADDDWMLLTEDWQEEIIDNYDDWKNSLAIYSARNGDQLLLHPDGHVGWWKYAEGYVEREFESLSKFMEFYVQFRADVAWPLDSYGAPDYVRNEAKQQKSRNKSDRPLDET